LRSQKAEAKARLDFGHPMRLAVARKMLIEIPRTAGGQSGGKIAYRSLASDLRQHPTVICRYRSNVRLISANADT
jgi:hypothetical protein